jgi:uncharacterized protein
VGEIDGGKAMSPPAITGVATAITAFAAPAPQGPFNTPLSIASVADFASNFGSVVAAGVLGSAVLSFFANGGQSAYVARVPQSAPPTVGDYGDASAGTGLYSLDTVPLFNLLCLPAVAAEPTLAPLLPIAAAYCERRRAMLLVDLPPGSTVAQAQNWLATAGAALRKPNVAAYFPALVMPNPGGSGTVLVGCTAAVAGIYAQNDATRGAWQAPAGTAAVLTDVVGLALDLTPGDVVQLSGHALNCLRTLPAIGSVVWGDRTMAGADGSTSQWQYVQVRRMTMFLEQSIVTGLQWAVFEPNDPALWAQIRTSVGNFLQQLFTQGAFAGTTPNDSYFVRCDNTTVTAADIAAGLLNIQVGFALLQPAEFVIVQIQLPLQP